MGYKIRKYSNFKKRNIFDTYEPEKKLEFSKEKTIPWLFRICSFLVCLGGLISFWASGGLMLIKSFFSFKNKVKRFSFNNKVVELRIKKKTL